MNNAGLRTRWAAVGAAVAITMGAGGIGLVSATAPADAVAYVPIEPCRLADTRPGDDNVGPRATPLGTNETHTIAAHGDQGECVGIPVSATGLQLNITPVGATAPTFLTIWATGDRPLASSLNPTPGQAPIPNAVTAGLTDSGEFNVYNLAGFVDVVIDVAGYFTDHDHDDRYYTETEADAALAAKADADDVYTSAESDDLFLGADQDSEGAIDGDDSTDLVGDADEVVATVTIDTPTSGYVIVNSSGYGLATAGDTGARCSISTSMILADILQNQSIADGGRATIAGTRGFRINKADIGSPAQSTYHLVCDKFEGNDWVLHDAQLTAIFVPDPDAFGLITATSDGGDSSPVGIDD